ncbi:MAG: CPBP family intramembrane glutamic endopeptidase [Pseudomonadota bacterium]
MTRPLIQFGFTTLAFYAALWTALWLSPDGSASNVVAAFATGFGALIVRPGWNIRPRQPSRHWAALLVLLLGSAVIAAYFLRLFKIPVPYDAATLNILAVLPGVIAITGAEELLFRQVMFRWLEKQQLSEQVVVMATSAAFGVGHLGPVIAQTAAEVSFYLLLSVYMIWVGALLGEIRNATGSWAMSWVGHAVYNLVVLFILSLRS